MKAGRGFGANSALRHGLRLPTTPVGERRLVFGIVGLGLLFRVVVYLTMIVDTGGGEAGNVAAALADGRGFADAFWSGSGPTAHLTPTTPVLAGAIYALFGVGSAFSQTLLLAWSLVCFAASALLLNRLFRRLGAALPARLIGLGIMCFVPVFLTAEIMVFRYWEGQLTFALLLFSLDHGLGQRDRLASRSASVVAVAILAAIILLNPVIGLVAGIAYAATMLGRRTLPRLAVELVCLVCLVAPPTALWAARNQAVIGAPILLRDNLGLELSFKANDEVLREGANPVTIVANFNRLHPDGDANGYGRLRAKEIGEHAYKVELQREVFTWIAANPTGFAWIAAQGWVQYFFPSPLYFDETGAVARASFIWLIDLAGLLIILVAIRRRRPGWAILGLVVVLIAAAYAPFVYLWRYHYPVYNLLVFSAACGAWGLIRDRFGLHSRQEPDLA